MIITNVIADWDGTFTVMSKEAVGYLDNYLVAFSKRSELSLGFLVPLVEKLRYEIAADDHRMMFVNNLPTGRANVSPYDLNRAVFTDLIEILRARASGVLPSVAGVDDYLHSLHKEAHHFTSLHCYPESRAAISCLNEQFNLVFATSSGTEKVRSNLESFGLDVEVFGDAKKYSVDPTFTEVPEFLPFSGIEVLLRRRKYYSVLKFLEQERGFSPSETVVVGDIFSHDLALPVQLGYGVVLQDNSTVIDVERSFLRSHPRGWLVKDLDHLYDVLVSRSERGIARRQFLESASTDLGASVHPNASLISKSLSLDLSLCQYEQ
jgi:hypothetical protein